MPILIHHHRYPSLILPIPIYISVLPILAISADIVSADTDIPTLLQGMVSLQTFIKSEPLIWNDSLHVLVFAQSGEIAEIVADTVID